METFHRCSLEIAFGWDWLTAEEKGKNIQEQLISQWAMNPLI